MLCSEMGKLHLIGMSIQHDPNNIVNKFLFLLELDKLVIKLMYKKSMKKKLEKL